MSLTDPAAVCAFDSASVCDQLILVVTVSSKPERGRASGPLDTFNSKCKVRQFTKARRPAHQGQAQGVSDLPEPQNSVSLLLLVIVYQLTNKSRLGSKGGNQLRWLSAALLTSPPEVVIIFLSKLASPCYVCSRSTTSFALRSSFFGDQ